jgi:hypothetical protein
MPEDEQVLTLRDVGVDLFAPVSPGFRRHRTLRPDPSQIAPRRNCPRQGSVFCGDDSTVTDKGAVMTVAKVALAGLLIALAVGAIVLFWQYLLIGAVILLVALWLLSLANSQPASISPAEQERRRRSFVNYQISQDMAERREAHREAMAQWRQQQQPPPRDPANWGGGGGRYC